MYGISNNTTKGSKSTYGDSDKDVLKSDWGNTIGTGWRTLTKDEWVYVFGTNDGDKRPGSTVNGTSDARYTHATINTDNGSDGVKGIILFPDGITVDNGEATSWGNINSASDWGTKCTTAQWTALAAKGCVFLPTAGYRYSGTTITDVGTNGNYWSSTSLGVNDAYRVSFRSSNLYPSGNGFRSNGYSVRLVKDAN